MSRASDLREVGYLWWLRCGPAAFATHYHELTDLANTRDAVSNFNVAVREWNEEIIFLRKILPGPASTNPVEKSPNANTRRADIPFFANILILIIISKYRPTPI